MKTTLLVLGMGLMLTLAGCSKSPEEGAIDTLDELNDIVDGVKTKADAEKIKTRLSALMLEFKNYGKELQDRGPEALNTETGKKLAAKTMEFGMKMMALMSIPEVAEVLREEFKKFKGR